MVLPQQSSLPVDKAFTPRSKICTPSASVATDNFEMYFQLQVTNVLSQPLTQATVKLEHTGNLFLPRATVLQKTHEFHPHWVSPEHISAECDRLVLLEN